MATPDQSTLARPFASTRVAESKAAMPWRSVPWWLLVVAMLCQSLLARGGTVVAALYVGSMLSYVAAMPRQAARAACADIVPWLYPVIALASVMWSDASATSLRLGLELCVTTGGMMAIGRRVSTRDLVSGLMLALLLAGVASIAVGTRASLISNNIPLTGIYASKNLLAFHMVLLVLCGVAALLDQTQPRLVRLAALPAVLLGLVMIRGAQSAGASVMGALALMVLLGVTVLGGVPRRLQARLLACALISLACLAAVAAVSGHELLDAFFSATGKNAGLTGRTFLWQRAGQLIGERPTLGYGYQAFWRQNYPEAEALWRYFKISDRGGFHFHNLYYEVSIELGLLGLLGMIASLTIYAGRAVRHAVLVPGPQSGLLLAICVLLIARSGIEVDLGFPFGTMAALAPILFSRRSSAWPTQSQQRSDRMRPKMPAPLEYVLAADAPLWPVPVKIQ